MALAKFCPNCGLENPNGEETCLRCGTMLGLARGLPITNREDHSNVPSATTREGTGSGSESLVRLPAALAERYVVERELPARGNEADLLVAGARDDGTRVVIKLYRTGIEPKAEVLRLIAGLDGRYVIRQLEYGSSEGRFYEVMEFAADGSFTDLLRKRRGPLPDVELRPMVTQVAAALQYLHGLTPQLVHRDVKPDNLLVRNLNPLEIVLTDFGIASVVEGGSRIAGSIHRTILYAAPEAMVGDISPAMDWWSLGMMVAEAAAGRHPFLGVTDQAIAIHFSSRRAIPLEAVTESRAKLLCQGLLAYDQRQRWGANEVQRWLDGDATLSAPVEAPPERPGTGTSEPRASRPYRLGSHECYTARELAAAICANWDAASRDVARFTALYNWLVDQLGDHNAARWLQDLTEGAGMQQLDPGVKLSLLLPVLDSDLPPIFESEPLTPERLIDLAATRGRWGGSFSQLWDHVVTLASLTKADWLEQSHSAYEQILRDAVQLDRELRELAPDLQELDNDSLLHFALINLATPERQEDLEAEAAKVLNAKEALACSWAAVLRRDRLGPAGVWVFKHRSEAIIAAGERELAKLARKKNQRRKRGLILLGVICCAVVLIGISILFINLQKRNIILQERNFNQKMDERFAQSIQGDAGPLQYSIFLQRTFLANDLGDSGVILEGPKMTQREVDLRAAMIKKLWQSGLDSPLLKPNAPAPDIRSYYPVYVLAALSNFIGKTKECENTLRTEDSRSSNMITNSAYCKVDGVRITVKMGWYYDNYGTQLKPVKAWLFEIYLLGRSPYAKGALRPEVEALSKKLLQLLIRPGKQWPIPETLLKSDLKEGIGLGECRQYGSGNAWTFSRNYTRGMP